MASVDDAEPAPAPAVRPPCCRKRRRMHVGSAHDYEEIGRLGLGAFGDVVKARHRDTDQTVAIKRLPGGGDPSAVLREAFFLQDACASNPFVVGFRGVVRDKDQDAATSDLRLVMECAGPSLDAVLQHLHHDQQLPEATVRAAMWQLLTGVAKMHASGIVHRDIKPQNILVVGDGDGDGHSHAVLKLCDFGLAMSASEPPPYDPVGTLWYQAPEVLLDKDDYDSKVDVWALGCVMAELIDTGTPLFQGCHDDSQLFAIFDVLGVPDDSTWPWFSSTPFATVIMPEIDVQRCSHLRELFPRTKLSDQGFQVLSGLLTCNPEKRLTAAAALKLPWFNKIDALKLPKKEEVASAKTPTSMAAVRAPSGRKRRRMAVIGSTSDYEETCTLGHGTYGAVVKARHRVTGQAVAIKRLPGGDPAALLREASFLQRACASNPFVVGFHGVVCDEDQDPTTSGDSDLCLVMECVGPSLDSVLQQHRRARLPEATVRAAMRQLLTGAAKMHASGIVHRDIKPQNILVGGDDHGNSRVLKLCDFGLAVSTSDPPPCEPVGTLWYQAPEMLLDEEGYDSQIDTWALGCIMAELINTGRPLFQGCYDVGQLCAIFDVLGVPDDTTWPGFSSTAFATVVMPELDMQRSSKLRELFPETKLSEEGFQVLSGLLTCNPEKRLTAAAALKHPWFAKVDDALKLLPKTEQVMSSSSLPPLPKKRRMHAVMCFPCMDRFGRERGDTRRAKMTIPLTINAADEKPPNR
ncbi:hypothetical protein U9M48_009915 [Paspalum notatum var. saurae]|uniref:[RNA-polymerase]-subunit kinase n=1 Tax=Paspalum notatum var. saurae TaxID=547442 RepID=A0AAQ3SS93_PASNO